MRSGRGLTLAERSALSGVVPDRPVSRAGRRHCWVAAAANDAGGENGPWPGLVLDWQRRDGGWWAYVVYLAHRPQHGAGSRAVAVQEWVDAARLAPAAGELAAGAAAAAPPTNAPG